MSQHLDIQLDADAEAFAMNQVSNFMHDDVNEPSHTPSHNHTEQADTGPSQKQALEALHDIGNALHRISFFCAQLQHENNRDDCNRHLEAITSASDYCADLIRSLVQTSNQSTAVINASFECDAGAVANAAVENHRYLGGADINIDLMTPPQAQLICCLPKTYLYRCLSNLLMNAFQAISGDGKILVRVEPTIKVTRHVCASCERHFTGDFIRVSVIDNGRGIANSERNNIFKSFYTTRADGSGIGLAGVHDLMHQAGGHIDVESAFGGGSTFTLYLPALAIT